MNPGGGTAFPGVRLFSNSVRSCLASWLAAAGARPDTGFRDPVEHAHLRAADAEADHLIGLQFMFGDLFAIDEGPVGAAQIPQHQDLAALLDYGMLAGDQGPVRAGKADRILGVTSQGEAFAHPDFATDLDAGDDLQENIGHG